MKVKLVITLLSLKLQRRVSTHFKALSILYKTRLPSDLEIRTNVNLSKVAKFCQITQNKIQCGGGGDDSDGAEGSGEGPGHD